jgi:uncharacterized membrane protein
MIIKCIYFGAKETLSMPRHALKTLTYGLMHLVVAVAVAYAVTRNWQAALAVGLLEPLVQTVAYNFHERAWAKAGERPRLALAHAH